MTLTPAEPSSRVPRDAEVVQVAVASPLRSCFDYLPLDSGDLPDPGSRVAVPFRAAERVGVVLGHATRTEVPAERMRRVARVIDREALVPAELLRLLRWASEYFHHPIGEVVLGALPAVLRRGAPAAPRREPRWRLSEQGRDVAPAGLARAPRQAALLERLAPVAGGLARADLEGPGDWNGALRALVRKGWIEEAPAGPEPGAVPSLRAAPIPDDAQQCAVDTVHAAREGFGAFLLDGVTGSGKTEVYLELIERTVALGQQALVLVPEIGLTPQIVSRMRARLSVPVAVLHSGLSDGARHQAWMQARDGEAGVVIGTRSAVFAPLARPGLLVVDEEHDPSFKQQDGFRYSARDLAVVRARQCGVPVVLGSATPSLESLNNVAAGRYRELRLPRRAGGASEPEVEIVDLRGRSVEDGLSEPLVEGLAGCLARHEQALLFQNRRGYAPAMICHACGWVADCARCDAHLVYHRDGDRLRCHHCAAEQAPVSVCPQCGVAQPRPVGLGTQRVAEALAERFPGARIERLDRDSTRRKGALEQVLGAVDSGEVDILVGTQMLAKGHHFPRVTLVGILDADAGLFGADFRASERLAQLLVQVAGRAGRGDLFGRVLLQTHHPQHPLLGALLRSGYREFTVSALAERRAAALPPYAYLALLRAESARRDPAHDFLEAARHAARALCGPEVQVLGPVPAPMERRAGRYRAHLLVQAEVRSVLHRFLGAWLPLMEQSKQSRRVRWSLDVDPQEML